MPSGPSHARDGHPGKKTPPNVPSRKPPVQARLESLLEELGPKLRSGNALEITQSNAGPILYHSSGFSAVDRLIGGGFARGQVSEVVGPPSSGRTSLVLSLLAQATSVAGELVAVVDAADAFDPSSAERAGIDLSRVLWVRVNTPQEALRSTQRLLETEGIPLTLIDLDTPPTRNSRSSHLKPIPRNAWIQLAHQSTRTGNSLVVLSPNRQVGHSAHLVLELESAESRFDGAPPLLTQFESQATLLRCKQASKERTTRVLLRGSGQPPRDLKSP